MIDLTIKELFDIVDGLNENELRQELKARITDIKKLTKEIKYQKVF